jgi:hypothetical protein
VCPGIGSLLYALFAYDILEDWRPINQVAYSIEYHFSRAVIA